MSQETKKSTVKLPKDPILIVEDTIEAQELLQELCDDLGVKSVIAENGKVALDKYGDQKFSLYISDLMMPEMDGKTYIKHLKKRDPAAVVIIQSGLDSASSIIDVMKYGVYDYIIKPIDPDLFQATIIKALEYKYLKESEEIQSLNAAKKLRSQIDWLNYKEQRHINAKDFAETKSIYNLKTSLAQGSGFGSIITLIDIMKMELEEKDGKYIIDKEIVDSLLKNNEYCRTQIEGINYVAYLMEKDFELEDSDATTLIKDFVESTQTTLDALKEKQMTITFPELRRNCKLRYNKKIMALLQEELILNALKYGSPGSKINLFTHIQEGYFWFSVKNVVPTKPYGGIDKKEEILVLEPFYRIHPPVEQFTNIEKLGFGLGLTVVDYVIKKHHGLFFIKNASDITTDVKQLCVVADLLLPVIDENFKEK